MSLLNRSIKAFPPPETTSSDKFNPVGQLPTTPLNIDRHASFNTKKPETHKWISG